MAYPMNPNDPYRTDAADDELRRAALRDDQLQSDPDLADSSAGGGRIALYAVGIALVLGAVFYGLNNSNMHQAGTTPPAQSAQTQPASPSTPPGMRDVTPRTTDSLNSNPGTTTGAATGRPTPPTTPDMNRPSQPPAGTTAPSAPK